MTMGVADKGRGGGDEVDASPAVQKSEEDVLPEIMLLRKLAHHTAVFYAPQPFKMTSKSEKTQNFV